ncbi:hypothetical protein, partial [Parvibacter caecicola]|uniref:hypothetical protein n=1 Tax=Parvibacter caecicola TaxID=747645 RepID=UPI003F7416F9
TADGTTCPHKSRRAPHLAIQSLPSRTTVRSATLQGNLGHRAAFLLLAVGCSSFAVEAFLRGPVVFDFF